MLSIVALLGRRRALMTPQVSPDRAGFEVLIAWILVASYNPPDLAARSFFGQEPTGLTTREWDAKGRDSNISHCLTRPLRLEVVLPA